MSTVSINGVIISGDLSSSNITVQNGVVMVNGKDVTPDSKEIYIEVTGNVENLKVDACRTVSVGGVVGDVTTLSGDVRNQGNVGGSVTSTSGDITAGNVQGNVNTTSGDVSAEKIGGSVKTMTGDIRYK